MKLPRMWDWVLLTVCLFALVAWIAPAQMPLIVYKSLLVSIAAVMTYGVDRSLFARLSDRLVKDMPRDIVAAARVIARALLFIGCVVGITGI